MSAWQYNLTPLKKCDFHFIKYPGSCQTLKECLEYHWLEIDLGREEDVYAITMRSDDGCLDDRCRLNDFTQI